MSIDDDEHDDGIVVSMMIKMLMANRITMMMSMMIH